MKQAVMVAPGEIEFREIERPELGPDQVMLNTRRIGVCGSDIHVFHGMHPYTSYPIVQGHEVSGVVAEVGEEVEGFSVGDKITFAPQVVCGTCYPCRHGMYHICESLKVLGFQTDGTAQEFFPLVEGDGLPRGDRRLRFVEPDNGLGAARIQGGRNLGSPVPDLGLNLYGALGGSHRIVYLRCPQGVLE